MKRIFAFGVLFLLITNEATPILQVTCDASLINALKSRYHEAAGSTTVDVVINIACHNEDQKVGVQYDGVDVSWQDVKNACDRQDRKFFEKNYRRIAKVFLPPEAFALLEKICSTTGLRVSVSDVPGGNTLKIQATWVPPAEMSRVSGAGLATIESVPHLDGPARCSFSNLTKGKTLAAAPTIETCTRTGDGSVTVTLGTDRGFAFGSALRRKKVTYTLDMYPADDSATCALNGQLVASSDIGHSALDVDLTSKLKAGKNTLSCTVKDLKVGSNFLPSWSYHFELFQGSRLIWSPAFRCNDDSAKCGKRGETVTTFINY